MKPLFLLPMLLVLTTLAHPSFSQSINWKNLQPSQKHIVNLNVGFDNATTIGAGYGYQLKSKWPLVLNIEYSMPFGDEPFDDLKTKIGAQLNLVRSQNFFATIKAHGVIRRYSNAFTRMLNFGSEFSATAGVYKSRWFAAAEFGFDKAITTQLEHNTLMKEYNPSVESGWYLPNGGNFLYGLQLGYSFNRNDIYARAGKTIAQDLTNRAMLPVYVQLGVSRRF